MGAVSEQTVARVHAALLAKYGDQDFHCRQKELAAELGIGSSTLCLALRVLRSDGRLTRAGTARREIWRVYADPAPERAAAAAAAGKSVEEKLDDIIAALRQLNAASALPSPPPASAAAAPDPLQINVFFRADDQAELDQFYKLRARGGGSSLAEQTLEMYRACIKLGKGLPEVIDIIMRISAALPPAPRDPPSLKTLEARLTGLRRALYEI